MFDELITIFNEEYLTIPTVTLKSLDELSITDLVAVLPQYTKFINSCKDLLDNKRNDPAWESMITPIELFIKDVERKRDNHITELKHKNALLAEKRAEIKTLNDKINANEKIKDDLVKSYNEFYKIYQESKNKNVLSETMEAKLDQLKANIKSIEDLIKDDLIKIQGLNNEIDDLNTRTIKTVQKKKVAQKPLRPQPHQVPDPNLGDTLMMLKQDGKLPKNLSDKKIIDICNSLGINAKDMSFIPTDEQWKRLENDKEIKLAFANERIKKSHVDEKNKIMETYFKYYDMDTNGLHDNYKDRVDSEKENILETLKDYNDRVDSLEANTVMDHLDPASLDVASQIRLDRLDSKSNKVNEDLRKAYKDLDELNAAKAQTKIKQLFTNGKIKRTMKRIERLQKKSGRIVGKQIHIINKKTDKYIAKKEKELVAFNKKQEKTNRKIEEVNELNTQKQSIEEQIKQFEDDLKNTTGKNVSDRLERFALNRSKSKLEKQRDRLTKKIGKCDRRAQVRKTFEFLQKQQTAMVR